MAATNDVVASGSGSRNGSSVSNRAAWKQSKRPPHPFDSTRLTDSSTANQERSRSPDASTRSSSDTITQANFRTSKKAPKLAPLLREETTLVDMDIEPPRVRTARSPELPEMIVPTAPSGVTRRSYGGRSERHVGPPDEYDELKVAEKHWRDAFDDLEGKEIDLEIRKNERDEAVEMERLLHRRYEHLRGGEWVGDEPPIALTATLIDVVRPSGTRRLMNTVPLTTSQSSLGLSVVLLTLGFFVGYCWSTPSTPPPLVLT